MRKRKVRKNSHETSNLTPQRYTGSSLEKRTNSIAYTIGMTKITGSMLLNAYWGRPMKLASVAFDDEGYFVVRESLS